MRRNPLAIARLALVALAAWTLGSCGSGESLSPADGPVNQLVATALSPKRVRVRWPENNTVSVYRLERRKNREGEFAAIASDIARSTTTYDDGELEPATAYGYRLAALDGLGKLLGYSNVAGVTTPPVPGIRIVTESDPRELADADGYRATVVGAGDSLTVTVDANGQRVLSPLKPGAYVVRLADVAASCISADSLVRHVVVTDEGTETEPKATFAIACRDATRGRVVTHLRTGGDSIDPNGYQLRIAGVADDAQLPDAERIIAPPPQAIGPQGGDLVFENLRPGRFSLFLEDVSAACTVVPASRQVDFHLNALQSQEQAFDVTCASADAGSRPYVWRNSWSAASAPPGSKVALTLSLDLSSGPPRHLSSFTVGIGTDNTVLRADSIRRIHVWDVFTQNINFGPGVARLSGVSTDESATGAIDVAKVWYTVIGANGAATTSRTEFTTLSTRLGTGQDQSFTDQVRKVEAPFTVGPLAGGGGNQAPTARPGGPYAGTAGAVVTVSGTTSSDADGTIASYAWGFGDGGAATGATPTHTYAAAGTYTVSLTVTDDRGGTNTATTTAAIAGGGGGGGNQLPTARPGGPYAGVTGTAVSFSGATSSDPDGTIASYAWTFGDGGTASGATPTHTYATAGTYPVALTVTDNAGGSGSASTSATVTAPASAAFTWGNSFGPVNPADGVTALTIYLDLSTATAGEALIEWSVDSLKWDPAVLQFFSFNYNSLGSGGSALNTSEALTRGKLVFRASVNPSLGTGVVPIATVRLKAIGAPGTQTTTQTALGAVTGTGFVSYRGRTTVAEGTLTVP